jgi:hypothetical protein
MYVKIILVLIYLNSLMFIIKECPVYNRRDKILSLGLNFDCTKITTNNSVSKNYNCKQQSALIQSISALYR